MNKELKKRIFTSIILLSLLTVMYFYSFIMIGTILIMTIIIWIEFYALISKIIRGNRYQDQFLRYISKSASLLYLSIFVYFIFIIESNYINLKIYLLYSVLVAILSDIGGLVFGKTFKGKKLSKISPNKTVSGSIGSFVSPMVLIPIFYNKLITYDLLTLLVLTIIISLISQIGDLFISLLKRKAKVKDTSDLLPGHGGLLDRLDGIIFAAPSGVLLLNFLN
ncbi:phosphatidate cytidylyltransferase [Candidatus Pelagibacter sp.]|jgi:phosphatidate cytidylyltransferase|nr:phosphatidate cytidylyltransferase [Candidatus Pelagibacter sp.]